MTKTGYLYCFSNTLIPGLLKFGMTMSTTPEFVLSEANDCDWTPGEFKLELAEKVLDPENKIIAIHELLYAEQIHPTQDYFRVSLAKATALFKMYHEVYVDNITIKETQEEQEEREWNAAIAQIKIKEEQKKQKKQRIDRQKKWHIHMQHVEWY
jgi:hypothetical protein